jgi:hypothetical protein
MAKRRDGTLEERITKIGAAYWETLHAGIGSTPREARDGTMDTAPEMNSKDGERAKRMKKGPREEFKDGQGVRVAMRENLGAMRKRDMGWFTGNGTVMYWCDGDSYLIRGEDGWLRKRHYDLKAGACGWDYLRGDVTGGPLIR